jgi:hypothetical protein
MSLNAKTAPRATGKKTEQPIIEIGTYPARVVQLIDLGLQPQEPYAGQEKEPAHEILVGYELVDSFMVDEHGKEMEDKPRWVSERFPFRHISADMAKSTKRYKALDPDMVNDGEWAALINCPCMVTIAHKVGKGKHAGKTFIEISNVATMRAAQAAKCPELQNEPLLFLQDAPDIKTWERLPDWLKDKIKANLNFNGSKLQELLTDGHNKPSNEQKDQVAAAKEEVTSDEGDEW